MPVTDETWICQNCGKETGKRDAVVEPKLVSFRSCPFCGRVTKHKTILSDKSNIVDYIEPG